MARLIRDFPNLRDAIFRQLAARLPANPDLAKLDPVLLLALVEEAKQTVAAASPMHPIDNRKLQKGIDAANQILSRLASHNFPKAQAIDASFLLGIFQEYQGNKIAAIGSLLDHIDRFGSQPGSHADVALKRARMLIAQLRQSNDSDPQLQQLEIRFLPIAINPPFNRREFALQYAATLFSESKWAEAIKYYRMTPDTRRRRD